MPVWATTEEVEHIRKNMAYSNPEEVVKPMEHNEEISENMEITNNTENTGDIVTLLTQVRKPEQCENDSKSHTKTKTNSVSLVMEHNEEISENMEITNNTENTGDIVTLLMQV